MGKLSLADRATIANMSPEYGATMGFFPVDHVTLDYLKLTGRSDETVCFTICKLFYSLPSQLLFSCQIYNHEIFGNIYYILLFPHLVWYIIFLTSHGDVDTSALIGFVH